MVSPATIISADEPPSPTSISTYPETPKDDAPKLPGALVTPLEPAATREDAGSPRTIQRQNRVLSEIASIPAPIGGSVAVADNKEAKSAPETPQMVVPGIPQIATISSASGGKLRTSSSTRSKRAPSKGKKRKSTRSSTTKTPASTTKTPAKDIPQIATSEGQPQTRETKGSTIAQANQIPQIATLSSFSSGGEPQTIKISESASAQASESKQENTKPSSSTQAETRMVPQIATLSSVSGGKLRVGGAKRGEQANRKNKRKSTRSSTKTKTRRVSFASVEEQLAPAEETKTLEKRRGEDIPAEANPTPPALLEDQLPNNSGGAKESTAGQPKLESPAEDKKQPEIGILSPALGDVPKELPSSTKDLSIVTTREKEDLSPLTIQLQKNLEELSSSGSNHRSARRASLNPFDSSMEEPPTPQQALAQIHEFCLQNNTSLSSFYTCGELAPEEEESLLTPTTAQRSREEAGSPRTLQRQNSVLKELSSIPKVGGSSSGPKTETAGLSQPPERKATPRKTSVKTEPPERKATPRKTSVKTAAVPQIATIAALLPVVSTKYEEEERALRLKRKKAKRNMLGEIHQKVPPAAGTPLLLLKSAEKPKPKRQDVIREIKKPQRQASLKSAEKPKPKRQDVIREIKKPQRQASLKSVQKPRPKRKDVLKELTTVPKVGSITVSTTSPAKAAPASRGSAEEENNTTSSALKKKEGKKKKAKVAFAVPQIATIMAMLPPELTSSEQAKEDQQIAHRLDKKYGAEGSTERKKVSVRTRTALPSWWNKQQQRSRDRRRAGGSSSTTSNSRRAPRPEMDVEVNKSIREKTQKKEAANAMSNSGVPKNGSTAGSEKGTASIAVDILPNPTNVSNDDAEEETGTTATTVTNFSEDKESKKSVIPAASRSQKREMLSELSSIPQIGGAVQCEPDNKGNKAASAVTTAQQAYAPPQIATIATVGTEYRNHQEQRNDGNTKSNDIPQIATIANMVVPSSSAAAKKARRRSSCTDLPDWWKDRCTLQHGGMQVGASRRSSKKERTPKLQRGDEEEPKSTPAESKDVFVDTVPGEIALSSEVSVHSKLEVSVHSKLESGWEEGKPRLDEVAKMNEEVSIIESEPTMQGGVAATDDSGASEQVGKGSWLGSIFGLTTNAKEKKAVDEDVSEQRTSDGPDRDSSHEQAEGESLEITSEGTPTKASFAKECSEQPEEGTAIMDSVLEQAGEVAKQSVSWLESMLGASRSKESESESEKVEKDSESTPMGEKSESAPESEDNRQEESSINNVHEEGTQGGEEAQTGGDDEASNASEDSERSQRQTEAQGEVLSIREPTEAIADNIELYKESFVTRSKHFKELCKWAFEVCDEDNSGTIEKHELYRGVILVHLRMAKYVGTAATFPASRETIDKLFDASDVDNSGTIDEDEFQRIMVVVCGQVTSRISLYLALLLVIVPCFAKGTVLVLGFLFLGRSWFNAFLHLIQDPIARVPWLDAMLDWDTLPEDILKVVIFSILFPVVFEAIDNFYQETASGKMLQTISALREKDESPETDVELVEPDNSMLTKLSEVRSQEELVAFWKQCDDSEQQLLVRSIYAAFVVIAWVSGGWVVTWALLYPFLNGVVRASMKAAAQEQ